VGKYYADSKVEVSGFLARHYDLLLDFITFGMYSHFIKEAIEYMGIQQKDKILDLGCGTGRNTCLMKNYLSNKGSIIGLDISKVMVKQFMKKCSTFTNINVMFSRIDKRLPFENEIFDKILISFLIHGFPQDVREDIIKEAYRVLKVSGRLFVLDYNQFIFEESPVYIKVLFKLIECPYAFDFIKRDWEKILSSNNFVSFREKLFFKSYVRILQVQKR